MELNRHDCAVFGIGAAVGGLLAWAGGYIFFRKKIVALETENFNLNESAKGLREENDKLLFDGFDKISESVEKTRMDIPTQASDTGRDRGVLSRHQRDDIRERLRKNYEGTTNYAGLYSENPRDKVNDIISRAMEKVDDIEAELAERENPEDDEPEIDESYVDPREQEPEGDISTTLPESSKEADVDEFFKEHQKKKGRKPRIISVEEAANLPEYIETMTLFYYATNDVVVTEDGEVVEDPERIIGDALTKYDFTNNDEMLIFVMNYSLDTCYEISKILGSYEVD